MDLSKTELVCLKLHKARLSLAFACLMHSILCLETKCMCIQKLLISFLSLKVEGYK